MNLYRLGAMVGRKENNDSFYITLIVGLLILVALIRGCDSECNKSDVEVSVIKR